MTRPLLVCFFYRQYSLSSPGPCHSQIPSHPPCFTSSLKNLRISHERRLVSFLLLACFVSCCFLELAAQHVCWKLCPPVAPLGSKLVPFSRGASVSVKQDACLWWCGSLGSTVTIFVLFASSLVRYTNAWHSTHAGRATGAVRGGFTTARGLVSHLLLIECTYVLRGFFFFYVCEEPRRIVFCVVVYWHIHRYICEAVKNGSLVDVPSFLC